MPPAGSIADGRPASRRRRRLRLALSLSAALVALWLLISLAVAHRLTRRARPPYPEPVPSVEWGRPEPHRLRTLDGEEIGTWFVPGARDFCSVLLVHGIGADRSATLGRAKLLAEQGCSVLMISLRAHGDSTGSFNDMGYGARHDVVAGVEFLERATPGSPIVVHGLSMGAAAAAFASRTLGDRVGGYILESPYRDLETAVRNRTEEALPPVLDRIAYAGLRIVAPLVLPDLDETSTVRAAGHIPADAPVLILSGAEDPVARPEEARAILDRVRSHGRLVLFPHAGHLNFPEADPGRYRRAIGDFLRAVGPGRPRPTRDRDRGATPAREHSPDGAALAVENRRFSTSLPKSYFLYIYLFFILNNTTSEDIFVFRERKRSEDISRSRSAGEGWGEGGMSLHAMADASAAATASPGLIQPREGRADRRPSPHPSLPPSGRGRGGSARPRKKIRGMIRSNNRPLSNAPSPTPRGRPGGSSRPGDGRLTTVRAGTTIRVIEPAACAPRGGGSCPGRADREAGSMGSPMNIEDEPIPATTLPLPDRRIGRREALGTLAACLAGGRAVAGSAEAGFRIATFSADVTPPMGHPLMGGGIEPAREVVDRLSARGFVLSGDGKPVVLAAIDWCEIRNDAFDRWREALAEAAGTEPRRVLVAALHQHDAPISDLAAQRLLDAAHAPAGICEPEFHGRAVREVARAVRDGLKEARRVTHVGAGRARVEGVASNRRYLGDDGRPAFGRMSATRDPVIRDRPEGLIDPWLRTLSFWDGDRPVLALSVYATHPMSHYGRGGVSADFIGMARRRRQDEQPGVFQVYATGCGGNVTAGKYNDGSPANREVLAGRVHRAMVEAWAATERSPVERLDFRAVPLRLEPRDGPGFTVADLRKRLETDPKPFGRCLAAMGLAWRARADAGHAIDVPALDLGRAQLLLLPGESYVEYQLLAQQTRPDSFVVTLGYGEAGTGYIPTDRHFDEGDTNLIDWCWVARGSEARMARAIAAALRRR
ncbi:Alpha/beta hydrolase family protein [Aquisphaera giovannonii]|uniref:Alpha/beta hydrolase family protein n=1 Tax=Aquisphaera giovannonii TaxID=406548 RepID=A0A5B9W5A4_9BACT|nr:alpha/beta fold hydrolase [Aquisphaera giovannonii]QEH35802.1 Alpha/beta hydrolase family protein [Aquisphaera giovannonii]